MSIRFQSGHGRIVIFLDRHAVDGAVFRRAIALGPEVEDPLTGDTWIPALRPDGVVTLIDPTMVIDVQPTYDGAPRIDGFASD